MRAAPEFVLGSSHRGWDWACLGELVQGFFGLRGRASRAKIRQMRLSQLNPAQSPTRRDYDIRGGESHKLPHNGRAAQAAGSQQAK